MTRWLQYAPAALAGVFAAYLLLWETVVPVAAVRFMVMFGRFELRALAIVAPFVLAFVLTAVGLVMGVMSFRKRRAVATWVWVIVADVAAPIVALGGHWLAVALLGAGRA